MQPATALAGLRLTAFICTNCARQGQPPTSGVRRRPSRPEIEWPCAAQEILVPCAGRLQPEHLLKAFEQGADAVSVVACDADNCHNVEGSCRAARRVDYVRKILDDIGLGAGRLILAHLPGSAREDMALGAGEGPSAAPDDLAARLEAVRREAAEALSVLTPNLMREQKAAAVAAETVSEVEDTDDNDE
jgi:coenzyme F420-reducing hydrogenase delta subunit